MNIPLNQTLALRFTGTWESTHLKLGKQVFAEVTRGYVIPGCTLEPNAVVYGRVTEVSSSKSPDSAQLGLIFDRADCSGQSKKPVSFVVVAVLPPPGDSKSLHDAIPTEVRGARKITDTVTGTTGYDAQLRSKDKPDSVQPGVVVGNNKMKLEPFGGPECSARFTSTTRSVQLAAGSELLVVFADATSGGRP